MSVHLEKYPGKAQDMLRYMHNICSTASRVCHNDWSKYDERYPSSSWGIVVYELWVMFVNTPKGLANSQDETPDHYGSSGINSIFQAVQSLKPILVIINHIPSLSSSPARKCTRNCFALNGGSCTLNPFKYLHRCSACGGPHPQAHYPIILPSLYSLATTRIVYELCYVLQIYLLSLIDN